MSTTTGEPAPAAGPRPSTELAGTASGPTAGSVWRSARGPLLVLALLVAVLVASALARRGGPEGRLEPEAYSPGGARALATLLEDRGVDVRRVETVDGALGGSARSTLLVPTPARLTDGELARLSARPGELVVLEAGQDEVDALGLDVDARAPVPVEDRRPACALPAAERAGTVPTGGTTYRADGAVGCYASSGRATLMRLPADRVVLVGSGALFTNERLDEGGAAALALGLLGTGDEVRWLVPAPNREVADGGQTPLSELLPPWVGLGSLQLLVAAAVLALWRARQLGRVVPEALPVVVRSAEAVEGRARLYRAAGARDRAAAALRAAVRDRVGRRLGLPPGADRAALVAAVAARTGRPAEDVDGLLHGGAPADDAALVALADALDALADEAGERIAVVTEPETPPDALAEAPAPRKRAPRKTAPRLSKVAVEPREALVALRDEVGKAVVGQDAAVTGLVIALLCRGHVLLEGVPGVAKTLLVRALAASLALETKRVQFTPDLMPGDVTGSLVYDARSSDFVFRAGPVFTNLLLADEINRTPPKTQASLLEAMEERQVTVDGQPRLLPDPFVVVATQNPVEYEGTYPLPEAQLDRFLLKLTVPLPEREDEVRVLQAHDAGFDPRDLSGLSPVAGPQELAAGRAAVREVSVAPEVLGYVVDVCRATRSSPSLQLGVSPRGATALLSTSKAWAWLSGRDFVTPDDVKALARPTLRHRVALRPEAELEGVTAEGVLDGVLASVPVPR